MHVRYHKKCLFEKEKIYSSNCKTIQFFSMNDTVAFKTHLDLIGKLKWIGKMMYNLIK